MIDLVEFHSFVSAPLNRDSVVVDLGANRGNFCNKMQARYGASCYAVEANPALVERLSSNSAAKSYHFAILDRVGTVPIAISSNLLASTVFSGEGTDPTVDVPSIDLESFLEHAGIDRIDLLKVDIEGAELPMLAACSDETLKRIPQITIEFHDFCGLNSTAEVRAAIARLEALGFVAIRFSRVGHQDTLLVNPALVHFPWYSRIYAKYIYRNFKGFARVLRKLIKGQNWALGYS